MRAIRNHWLIWTTIVVLLLVCLPLYLARSSMSSVRRFTSRPLASGSRITFLYPAYLTNVTVGSGTGISYGVLVSRRGGEQPFDVNRTPWGSLARRMGFSHAETVNVMVSSVNDQAALDGRTFQEWSRGSTKQRNVRIVDARSKTQVDLFYACAADAGQFSSHAREVTESLRIIPPKLAVNGLH